MQEEIDNLKGEIASQQDHAHEEGEILEVDKEATKEEITKSLTQTLD